MIHKKKVIVVLPAYNAAETLAITVSKIPMDVVDDIILVDDSSDDNTVAISEELGLKTITHKSNKGYGANQKTCYEEALKQGGDVIIMLHPDYQYNPSLIPAMASMVAIGCYDIVLGSRVLGRGALYGRMPLYKYISNRTLTAIENVLLNRKLSEYHTGFRAFSRSSLESISYQSNSDDFIFDNQILAQAIYLEMEIGEISCPASYHPAASSINLKRSIIYGIGVLMVAIKYRLKRLGIFDSRLFQVNKH